MPRFAHLLLCCLLVAGCQAVVPPAAPTDPPKQTVAESPPDTPPSAGAEEGCLEKAGESAACHVFNFTEQVASVAGAVVRGALVGLYILFFPLLGFGPGGPG